MKENLQELEAANETTTDLLINLFSAYREVKISAIHVLRTTVVMLYFTTLLYLARVIEEGVINVELKLRMLFNFKIVF